MGLIEIFARKENIEKKLAELQAEVRRDEIENQIIECKACKDDLIKQLKEEINDFKQNRENDVIDIIKKFFKDKYELNKNISESF